MGTLPLAFSVTVWVLSGGAVHVRLLKTLYVTVPVAVDRPTAVSVAVSCAVAPVCSLFVQDRPVESSVTVVASDVAVVATLNGSQEPVEPV